MKNLSGFNDIFVLKEGVYSFKDRSNNEYTIWFLGPLNSQEKIDSSLSHIDGSIYELEFLTQDRDYRIMTGSGMPFSISNLIFGQILEHFIRNKFPSAIIVKSIDIRRQNLYVRVIKRTCEKLNFNMEINYPENLDILIYR